MSRPWERPTTELVAPALHGGHPLLPAVYFSPCIAGLRPFLASHHWVVTFAASGRSFAILSRIRDSQHGWVLKAASVAQCGDRWEWVQTAGEYDFHCMKVEEKERVEASRERGLQDHHVDNSLLDRALMQRLAHVPTVLHLRECGHDGTFFYCVTELADNEPLIVAHREERPPASVGVLVEGEARPVLRAACVALAALHGAGWCHKDVSPENVLCMPAPDYGVRLIDFGSALPMARIRGGLGALPPRAEEHPHQILLRVPRVRLRGGVARRGV